jgi:hypothetical protein
MKKKFQFGLTLLATTILAALPGTALAQQKPANPPHPDRPPQVHQAPHASSVNPHPRSNTPQGNTTGTNRPPNATPPAHAQGNTNGNSGNNGANRNFPKNNFSNDSTVRNGAGANFAPRTNVAPRTARPWVDTMRTLTPQQRERVFQNSRAFQSLAPDKQNKIRQQFNQWDRMTPSQRSDLQRNEQVWEKLTPGQRDHLKNEVIPRWRQMPWDRQQMMKQKLGVLQNMPESARNQRLNDPNFTRGMSDDERSMLHDLSHTHVGGLPEAPTQ